MRDTIGDAVKRVLAEKVVRNQSCGATLSSTSAFVNASVFESEFPIPTQGTGLQVTTLPLGDMGEAQGLLLQIDDALLDSKIPFMEYKTWHEISVEHVKELLPSDSVKRSDHGTDFLRVAAADMIKERPSAAKKATTAIAPLKFELVAHVVQQRRKKSDEQEHTKSLQRSAADASASSGVVDASRVPELASLQGGDAACLSAQSLGLATLGIRDLEDRLLQTSMESKQSSKGPRGRGQRGRQLVPRSAPTDTRAVDCALSSITPSADPVSDASAHVDATHGVGGQSPVVAAIGVGGAKPKSRRTTKIDPLQTGTS